MFDFIPIHQYIDIFFYFIWVLVLVTWSNLYRANKFKTSSILDIFLVFVLIFYIGLRPISSQYFGDMENYARNFQQFQIGFVLTNNKDVAFQYFMLLSSKIMTVELFFLICSALYIGPLYFVCKKWFGIYWYYAFLMLVASFSFWSYGTNGIRNGIAGSLFLFGVSRDKRVFQAMFLILAIGFHKSMILPVLGLIIASFYNRPKNMIAFWLLCIPLSLLAGRFWEVLFSSLGFDDDRLSYLNVNDSSKHGFSSTGFRWDFLIYGAVAIFSGWFFIVKKEFEDRIYFLIFNIYIFCNAFWILVIRANFSNRFAYLSWFMMALVIVYPFLKIRLLKNQPRILGGVILAYFAFTYLLNLILS